MPNTSDHIADEREILLVGPYGVLGTGVVDAVSVIPHGESPRRRGDRFRRTGPTQPPGTSQWISWNVKEPSRRSPVLPESPTWSLQPMLKSQPWQRPSNPTPGCSSIHSMHLPHVMFLFNASCWLAEANPTASAWVPSMLQRKRASHV
jgi:hypothetical protein